MLLLRFLSFLTTLVLTNSHPVAPLDGSIDTPIESPIDDSFNITTNSTGPPPIVCTAQTCFGQPQNCDPNRNCETMLKFDEEGNVDLYLFNFTNPFMYAGFGTGRDEELNIEYLLCIPHADQLLKAKSRLGKPITIVRKITGEGVEKIAESDYKCSFNYYDLPKTFQQEQIFFVSKGKFVDNLVIYDGDQLYSLDSDSEEDEDFDDEAEDYSNFSSLRIAGKIGDIDIDEKDNDEDDDTKEKTEEDDDFSVEEDEANVKAIEDVMEEVKSNDLRQKEKDMKMKEIDEEQPKRDGKKKKLQKVLRENDDEETEEDEDLEEEEDFESNDMSIRNSKKNQKKDKNKNNDDMDNDLQRRGKSNNEDEYGDDSDDSDDYDDDNSSTTMSLITTISLICWCLLIQ